MNKVTLANVLNNIGIMCMLAVIILMLPLSLPRLFGVQIFSILTESMTPLYRVGGVVYVSPCDPDKVEVGDVISYMYDSSTGLTITHRVVDIWASAFITKGDANASNDPEPIEKERLVGRVSFYIPYLGTLYDHMKTVAGKCVTACIFIVSLTLWLIADIINPEKKEKKKKNPGTFLTAAGVLLVLAGVGYLTYISYGYHKAEKEYDAVRNVVFLEDSSKETASNASDLSPKEDMLSERLLALQEKNPDYKAWVMIDDTPISYPIMQASNNNYYLRRTAEGEYNTSGSIFLDYRNNPEFADRYTIVYGHNMRNDSMFGTLLKYRDAQYAKEHPQITIYTTKETITYEIFAALSVDPSDYLYDVSYVLGDEELVATAIQAFYSVTETTFSTTVDTGDDIVVLSTCTDSGKQRFVVVGRRVK